MNQIFLDRKGKSGLTLVLLGLTCGFAARGQTLPATVPTLRPYTTAAYGDPVSTPSIAAPGMKQAQVSYENGFLTVRAENSSFHQILDDISHTTGLKITGGIGEERVFGTYGPANLQEVLMRLLDGTDSNILLRQDARLRVTELVLSARQGRPAPPGPLRANTYASRNDEPPAPGPRRRTKERGRSEMSPGQLLDQPAAKQSAQTSGQLIPSPNGVRTPDEFGTGIR